MKSLYLRIYLTVVLVLLLFAAASGWVFQRHIEQERVQAESMLTERMGAWAELIQRSLPGTDAAAADQADALRDWSQRLRLPLALDSAAGTRIGESDSFTRRQSEGIWRTIAVRLEDGRTLWLMRPGLIRAGGGQRGGGQGGGPGGGSGGDPDGPRPRQGSPDVDRPPPPNMRAAELPWFPPFVPPGWPRGLGLVVVLVVLFFAVAAGAFPVVRRLTRRLEALKRGVEQFGAGQLQQRVDIPGNDEVAAVAASFNIAAERIEVLVRSHKSLLANASHELRSPLARMKMAVSMLEDAAPPQRERLKHEIDTNVAELDALVEEVLLASRLDASNNLDQHEPVDLLGLAAEEAARVDGSVEGIALSVSGDERLLRRALRNLLENARRYGGNDVSVLLERDGACANVKVCDRGPGVPETMRERIFEPFFRLPGHAEQAGGVGLGLSLVKQIAERHGGQVRCEARPGGGSCFVLALPALG